jgi:hypothetical protein
LPPRLVAVLDKPERVTVLDNDARAVEDFITARARAVAEKV